jgi:GNAT superfamily N-acetyltransferase
MPPNLHIRAALPTDVPILRTLIECSVRELQANDYTPLQIEGALETVFGVDSQLIADGTYLVAEAQDTNLPLIAGLPAVAGSPAVASLPAVAGCGGWSKRRTLSGADRWTARQDDLLDPRHDAAKIRAFFIHPAWARRGVGTLLLAACENAAKAAGFTHFEMGATLTGAKLFATKGYAPVKHLTIPLRNGASLPIIHMHKYV